MVDSSSTQDEISAVERDALLSVAHGAVMTSSGISIQRCISVAIEGVLTRGLGPGMYGVYAFGWRIATIGLTFANSGATETLLRDIPAFIDERQRQRRSLGLAYVSTAVVALSLAGATVVWADAINDLTINQPVFPTTLRLFGALLVASAFVRMHAASLKAAKSARGEVLLNRICYPTSRLFGALVAVGLGYSVVGVIGAIVVAVSILSVVAYPLTVRSTGLRPTYRGLTANAVHFFDHAVPNALGRIGMLFRTRIDVVLIGVLLTATDAGVYNVVLVLVSIAAIPLYAFNQLMPPVASELYSSDEVATLNSVYSSVTRLTVTVTVPLVILLAMNGQAALGLFGPEFRRGYSVLLVFLVGRFIGNAVGATGILLSMTNNHYPKMILEWLLAILNIVFTYVFVMEFGLIGAALGTSLAIALQNLLQAIVLWRAEGLWPFDRTFLKPLGVGSIVVVFMAAARLVITGPIGRICVVLTGMLAYLYGLKLVGIEPSDAFVIRNLAAEYRTTIAENL